MRVVVGSMIALAGLLGPTTGCGGPDTTGAPPTHDRRDLDDGLADGVLDGELDCLWLVGRDGAVRALVFPSGTTTRRGDGDEVIVLDADEGELARTGDRVEVGGSFQPSEPSCREGETGAIVASSIGPAEERED